MPRPLSADPAFPLYLRYLGIPTRYSVQERMFISLESEMSREQAEVVRSYG